MSNRRYDIEWYREEDDKEEVYDVIGTVEAMIRGRFSGPPESCYPDEGGEAEITKITDSDGKLVDIAIFSEEELRDMEYRLFQKACDDDDDGPEFEDDDRDAETYIDDMNDRDREDN
jgi:hypothetical protein